MYFEFMLWFGFSNKFFRNLTDWPGKRSIFKRTNKRWTRTMHAQCDENEQGNARQILNSSPLGKLNYVWRVHCGKGRNGTNNLIEFPLVINFTWSKQTKFVRPSRPWTTIRVYVLPPIIEMSTTEGCIGRSSLLLFEHLDALTFACMASDRQKATDCLNHSNACVIQFTTI